MHRLELRGYRLDAAAGWAIDGESLLEQADERTRAVLLVSPHNPTGVVYAEPLAHLEHLGVPLICDEVFCAFA